MRYQVELKLFNSIQYKGPNKYTFDTNAVAHQIKVAPDLHALPRWSPRLFSKKVGKKKSGKRKKDSSSVGASSLTSPHITSHVPPLQCSYNSQFTSPSLKPRSCASWSGAWSLQE